MQNKESISKESGNSTETEPLLEQTQLKGANWWDTLRSWFSPMWLTALFGGLAGEVGPINWSIKAIAFLAAPIFFFGFAVVEAANCITEIKKGNYGKALGAFFGGVGCVTAGLAVTLFSVGVAPFLFAAAFFTGTVSGIYAAVNAKKDSPVMTAAITKATSSLINLVSVTFGLILAAAVGPVVAGIALIVGGVNTLVLQFGPAVAKTPFGKWIGRRFTGKGKRSDVDDTSAVEKQQPELTVDSAARALAAKGVLVTGARVDDTTSAKDEVFDEACGETTDQTVTAQSTSKTVHTSAPRL